MSSIKTPDWVKDAIFYQIFPDRFAKSEANDARTDEQLGKPSNLEAWDSPPTAVGFKGGDLLGVARKLDYLSQLGINAIYFNPIFQSAANHRYHTHDYYRIDPLLGGNDAFRHLLDEAHARGIRVVLDGVFNHASRGFFQFNDILENGPDSPYLDWFHVYDFPVNAYDHSRAPQYAAWWNLHALPKFNTDTPQVREFLWDVAEYWIKFGIDGWRLDVPGDIDDDAFWQEFRRRVKKINPEAYICGEIWHDARRWLQGDQFDSVMNYLFTKATMGFFVGEEMVPELVEGIGYAPVPALEAAQMAEQIEKLLALYPSEVTHVQLNLLGSHDTARFLSIAGGDRSALKLATLFQMVYPGAPCIYYGDEIGLEGGKDPACRGTMPWQTPEEWDEELLTFIRQAIALRHKHSALRRGSYRTLYAEKQTYVFERRDENEQLVITFNASSQKARLELPLKIKGTRLIPLFGEQAVVAIENNGAAINLPPRTGIVWQVEP